jgi:hypothetical protein
VKARRKAPPSASTAPRAAARSDAVTAAAPCGGAPGETAPAAAGAHVAAGRRGVLRGRRRSAGEAAAHALAVEAERRPRRARRPRRFAACRPRADCGVADRVGGPLEQGARAGRQGA